MEPVVVVLVMCGIILTIVGAGRAVFAMREALVVRAEARPPQPAGRWSPRVVSAVWAVISAYGLILASVGIVLSR